MADCRIRGDAGETIRAAAFEADTELGKRRRLASKLVCFDQPLERFLDCFREHVEFGAALLLLEDEERLREIRRAFLYFFAKDCSLRMLAAEAEHRGSGNVRMM